MIKIFLIFSILLNIHLLAESKSNNSKSDLRLGTMYYTGDGKEKNIKKAEQHFKKACIKRVSKACYYLGYIHLRGEGGVKVDKKKAMQSFSRACALSEHEVYCREYEKLKGYRYAK